MFLSLLLIVKVVQNIFLLKNYNVSAISESQYTVCLETRHHKLRYWRSPRYLILLLPLWEPARRAIVESPGYPTTTSLRHIY